METKIKKVVATVALAGAITAGTAGAAFAADSPSTGSGDATAQPAKGHPALRRAVRRGAVKVIVDTVGGTRADLRTALQGGKTISQYATDQGKQPSDVAAALVAAADAKIDQLVANGRITTERGETAKGKVPDRVDQAMNRQFGQHA